jgi:hypothetical protein
MTTIGSKELAAILVKLDGIECAAAKMGKSMLESFDREHSIRLATLVHVDALEAKWAAFHVFTY